MDSRTRVVKYADEEDVKDLMREIAVLDNRLQKQEQELVLLRRAVWQGSLIGHIGGGIMNCDAVAYNKEK